MNLLLRQTNALIRKNLLIICVRRPVATFVRALLIPIGIILFIAFSKLIFSSTQKWGISSPHTIRSFKDSLAASQGSSIVGFVDNGMKGGEISSVIESLSRTVTEAGKVPKLFEDIDKLSRECSNNLNGVTDCYGAVVFLSSPAQGSEVSDKGTWNYTIRGSSGISSPSSIDVTNDNNAVEIYQLPFQRAVDAEIISISKRDNTTKLPTTMKNIIYTSSSQDALDKSKIKDYLALCINALGALFTVTLIGIVYHMPTFVAGERELGMSSLIDTMVPGGSNIQGRFVRQISTWISFAAVYLPSWIVVGIVISASCFPKTSLGIPVGFTITTGLALTSFGLFGASCFRKSQLSGSIIGIIALLFAILPISLANQTQGTALLLSFLCPSAAFTYFVTTAASFEAAKIGLVMWKLPPDSGDFRINVGVLWLILVVQILVFPILAFLVEHLLFSTASSSRVFATPSNPGGPTITLLGFAKTYSVGGISAIFKRRKNVHAVKELSFSAYPGQILVLLGPNGSGKSTTMNCIAGNQKVTSGKISLDPTRGIGYAPQHNVIWPELTVAEHIRIFSDLKCTQSVNKEVITELVRMCDLQKKLSSKSKTLSGGQKRKLQLAMMFAGGSGVCCVDEVSTGLDPISRRRIWEILLAERPKRTIIMTTHFLDEADYLADNIIIMYKGSLRAEGTSASLKNQYGNGYTVKVDGDFEIDIPVSGPVEKEGSRHQTVYRVATPALASEVVEYLQSQGVHDYQISGPTMEELFLKATGDTLASTSTWSTTENDADASSMTEIITPTAIDDLKDGHPISVLKQWWILFGKRFRIIRRRWTPYLVAVVFAIVGAGVAPLLIKDITKPLECPTEALPISEITQRFDITSLSAISTQYMVGPPDKIRDERLAQVADLYSRNHHEHGGFQNVTDLKSLLVYVNSLDEIVQKIQVQQTNNNEGDFRSKKFQGGIWLGEEPTVLSYPGVGSAQSLVNLFNVLDSGVPISSAYKMFGTQDMPSRINFKVMVFILYYSLILAVYPAFFALYPTYERISNARSMQYSNGIRPLPLWFSHIAFDGIFIIIISSIAIAILSTSTPIWFGLGYIFFIMVLYGLTTALLGYFCSMFTKSAVATFSLVALQQAFFLCVYYATTIGLGINTPYFKLEVQLNALFFGLGIVSPIICLERAFTIGLGQIAALCNGHTGGSIYLFGGPILYLIFQGIALFGLILWLDSTFKLPSFGARKPTHDAEATEMYTSDVLAEQKRLRAENTDLRVESVSKTFGKNLAVDNVTFGVQSSEIFALLGPNGAGKSTLISMIRGDITPSNASSAIAIAGHSILTSPTVARANLGVCPQFDSADALTINETLRFFAKIRGVSHIEHNVATVIAACGLAAWKNQLAHKLSGGTKRKLSLAVALVGNPRVLVLDEPSSALDANAKRTMWKCLQNVSKDRAVVLTTHSMEEADALADRIGIVSSRMLALGGREDLKRRAGENFHVHLVSKTAPRTTPEELAYMKDWIAKTFVDAQVSRETRGGQIRFEVPTGGHDLVALIRMLEEVKDGLGVEFFSVGKATLDEVFENIVKKYGDYSEK